MEREYICWRTGAGLAVFAVGVLVAPLVVLAFLRWLPDNVFAFMGAWSVAFLPFLRLANWADRRRMRQLRARSRRSTAGRTLGAALSWAGILVSLHTADVLIGRQVLRRWDVPVTVRVLDAATGAGVADVRVQFGIGYLFPIEHLSQRGDTVEFVMPMQDCRGEGHFFGRWQRAPRPDAGKYRLVFAAEGYEPAEIRGASAHLVATADAGRSAFAYAPLSVSLRPTAVVTIR